MSLPAKDKQQQKSGREIERDFLKGGVEGARNDKNKYTQHNWNTIF
jgi:hypothetical protein